MLLTLLSAIFGGALRLAPEILKFMGQKDQDAHELAMQDNQYLFQQLQGKQQMEAAQVQGDINLEQQQLQTINECHPNCHVGAAFLILIEIAIAVRMTMRGNEIVCLKLRTEMLRQPRTSA